MSPGAPDVSVASPCTSLCILDSVTGFCAGCYRTLDEIAGWTDFSSAQKRGVIVALDARRSKFGAAIESRISERMDDSAQR